MRKSLTRKKVQTSLPTCSLLLYWLCLCDEELKREKKKNLNYIRKDMADIWKHYLQPWRSMLSCLSLSGSTFSCFGQWSCLSHPAIAHSVAINIYILPLMIAFGRLLGFKGPLFELHTGESKILSIKCWHLSRSSLMSEGEKKISETEPIEGQWDYQNVAQKTLFSQVWMLSLHRGSTVLPVQKYLLLFSCLVLSDSLPSLRLQH